MSQETLTNPRVEITYSPLAGCTLKAVILSQDIQRCYELPVRVRERAGGVFEVTVNGVSLYRREGPCDPGESHEAIFLQLDRYRQRLRELPAPAVPEDEDDEQYRAWRRALCSGE